MGLSFTHSLLIWLIRICVALHEVHIKKQNMCLDFLNIFYKNSFIKLCHNADFLSFSCLSVILCIYFFICLSVSLLIYFLITSLLLKICLCFFQFIVCSGRNAGRVLHNVPHPGDPHVPELPQRGLPHHLLLHTPSLILRHRGNLSYESIQITNHRGALS